MPTTPEYSLTPPSDDLVRLSWVSVGSDLIEIAISSDSPFARAVMRDGPGVLAINRLTIPVESN